MFPASRAKLGRFFFTASSRILARTLCFVDSSSITTEWILSMPRVLGSVRAAAAVQAATCSDADFPSSTEVLMR